MNAIDQLRAEHEAETQSTRRPMGSGPGGQLLPGDPGYLSNERRYGGQPLGSVQPTIGYTPESELRAEYDRTTAPIRQRIGEQAGTNIAETPGGSKTAFVQSFDDYKSNVYKRQKSAKEALETRRLGVAKAEADIDAKKAEAEKDRRKKEIPYSQTKEAFDRSIESQEKIAGARSLKISDADKERLKNYRAELKAEQEQLKPDPSKIAGIQQKIDDTIAAYQKKSTTTGGTTQPQRQKQYVWKDEQGNLFTAPNETEVPAQYRRSARVIDLGEVQGGATLGGSNQDAEQAPEQIARSLQPNQVESLKRVLTNPNTPKEIKARAERTLAWYNKLFGERGENAVAPIKPQGQVNYGPSGENMTVGDVVAKLADSVGEEQARKFTESLSKKYGGNPSLDMKIDPSVIKEIQSAARETGIAASFINDWLATMWNTAGIATKNVGRGIANIPIPGTRK